MAKPEPTSGTVRIGTILLAAWMGGCVFDKSAGTVEPVVQTAPKPSITYFLSLDSSGKFPASGAKITLHPKGKTGITDSIGRVRFDSLERGAFVIESRMGDSLGLVEQIQILEDTGSLESRAWMRPMGLIRGELPDEYNYSHLRLNLEAVQTGQKFQIDGSGKVVPGGIPPGRISFRLMSGDSVLKAPFDSQAIVVLPGGTVIIGKGTLESILDTVPPGLRILPSLPETVYIDRLVLRGTAADKSGIGIVKVNGKAASGLETWLFPLMLDPGRNPYSVEAFDTRGLRATLAGEVFRKMPPSGNTKLSALSLMEAEMTPGFEPGVFTYAAKVPMDLKTARFVATAMDPKATLTVNGLPTGSGTTSAPVALSVGRNAIPIKVYAEDGSTQEYSVAVERPGDSTARLTMLVVSAGELSPAFSPDSLVYRVKVAPEITNIKFTAATTVEGVIRLGTGILPSDTASFPQALNYGVNRFTLTAVAQDGIHQRDYLVIVERGGGNEARLSGLSLASNLTLSPAFSPDSTTYRTGTTFASYVTVMATPMMPGATVRINGTVSSTSRTVNLTVGDNVIAIEVTGVDGTSRLVYSVLVKRSSGILPRLGSLVVSPGKLSPTFNPATYSYTLTIPDSLTQVTVITSVIDTAANLVRLTGAIIPSGIPTGISIDRSTTALSFVAESKKEGTSQSYTIMVSRTPGSNAALRALTLSPGTLSPVFSPETLDYEVPVAGTDSLVTVIALSADANAKLQLNGAAILSGVPSNPVKVNPGLNILALIVSSADGTTTRIYTLRVTR